MKYPTRESPRRDAASPIKYNGLRVPQTSSLSHCAQPAVPYRNIMDWSASAVLVFNGCRLSGDSCISTEKTKTRRNLKNINPKNTKITDSWEYECEDNLRFWWWSLSNCVRTAGKGHICEDSFAYGSYSSIYNICVRQFRNVCRVLRSYMLPLSTTSCLPALRY